MFLLGLFWFQTDLFSRNTSPHDATRWCLPSIGMEFGAYSGIMATANVRMGSSALPPCKAIVMSLPARRRKRSHKLAFVLAWVSLVLRVSVISAALSPTLIHWQKTLPTKSRKSWFQARGSLKSFRSRQNYF